MSFFDFIFPDQAQAMHLRTLAEQSEAATHSAHQKRLREARERRIKKARARNADQRIEELESELAEAGLVVEALIEILEESGTTTREAIGQRVRDIDARDGTVDGRIGEKPFEPKRDWPGDAK